MALPPYVSPLERLAHQGTRVAAALVLVFLVGPVLVVIPLSFTSGSLLIYPLPGLSLKWYEDFFTNPQWVLATRNSFALAAVVTVLATALGTLAALGLERASGRWKAVLVAGLVSPLVIPLIIVAVATFFFYARLGLAGSFAGLALAHTTLALPFVVVTVTAALKGFDADLMRASASLGASPVTGFRRVMLPLIAPGVFSGALFAFVTSFDEVVVALFLGSPELRTLPRQIWSGVRESISPTITAAAVVMIIVSVALMAVVEILRRRSERMRGERSSA